MPQKSLNKILLWLPLTITSLIIAAATFGKSNKNHSEEEWGKFIWHSTDDNVIKLSCVPDPFAYQCKVELYTKTTIGGVNNSYENGVQTDNNTEE